MALKSNVSKWQELIKIKEIQRVSGQHPQGILTTIDPPAVQIYF